MNCEEIRQQLSEYLDHALDAEHAKSVEHHLALCTICIEEYASLVECRRLVSDLPAVEPPVGFTTRVMAQVRDSAKAPSWWERLFLPLRIKIPLPAAALILIGILSVFLYQEEVGFKSVESFKSDPSPFPPSQKDEERTKDRPVAVGQPAPAKKQVEVAPKPPKEIAQQAIEETVQRTTLHSPERPAPAPKPAAPAELASRLEDKKEVAKRLPVQAQEVVAGREGARSLGGQTGVGAAAPSLDSLRQGVGRSAAMQAERSLSIQGDPVADYELVVRRRLLRRQDQSVGGDADSLRKRAESDAATQPAESRSSAPRSLSPQTASITEIIWYTVQQDRYEQFKKQLAAQGVIESETPVAAKEKESAQKFDRRLSIKVTILPPLAAEPALPSQPPVPSR